jgi:hypothetical protein
VDLVGETFDIHAVFFVVSKQLLVVTNLRVSFRRVTVEFDLKSCIERFNLLDQSVFHALKLFHIGVLSLLTSCFERSLHGLELLVFFFFDRLDHLT